MSNRTTPRETIETLTSKLESARCSAELGNPDSALDVLVLTRRIAALKEGK